MNPTRLRNRWHLALGVLLLCAACMASPARAQITVAPTDNLADKMRTATPGTVLLFDANQNYTLDSTVAVNATNTGLTLKGVGGNAARPDNLTITLLGGASIDLEQGATLNLENVTVVGGASYSILVPDDATLNVSQCLFQQGNPSIRLAGSPTTGGTLRAVNSVFANAPVGVRHQGGDAVFVQCTFTGTTPGITSSNGFLKVVACLFETAADAPFVSMPSSQAFWYGCLTGPAPGPGPVTVTGNENLVPSTFTGAALPAPPPAAITYSTDANAWPGKLDIAATPLLSGLSTTSTVIDSIINASAAANRREDFEGDLRASALQVGADELAAAQLAGWISSTIVSEPNIRTSGGYAVAGKSREVTIDIEVRGINLSNAEMVIVPELGSETDAIVDAVLPIQRLNDSYGRVVFTTPSSACSGGQVWDGLAQIFIRTGGTTLLNGTDSSLPPVEYQFIIDTTPPVLGAINGRPINDQYLNELLISNDPGALSSVLGGDAFDFIFDWGAQRVNGFNPVNAQTLGVADGTPQVYFNYDPTGTISPFPFFTLPMQFLDAPVDVAALGSPCAGTVSPTTVSGFNFDAPDLTVLADAFPADPTANPGTAYFEGDVPTELSAATFTQANNVAATFDELEVRWTFDNLIYSSGWNPALLPAVTDLAGNKYVHPNPLVFWWLDSRELVQDFVNLQFSGSATDPSFSWSITRAPRPQAKDAFPCYPVVSYRLWVADDAAKPLEGYDAVSDWSPYTAAESIDRNSIFVRGANASTLGEILADVDYAAKGMLLTVMVGDEAGNLQEDNMLATFSAAALNTDRIDSLALLDNEGVVPTFAWNNEADQSTTIDTRLRAKLFWNRVDSDQSGSEVGDIRKVEPGIPGERDFGSSTRIPLPQQDDCGAGFYTRVEGQFYVTAVSSSQKCDERRVAWQLTEDGRVVASGVVSVYREGNYTGVVQIPQDLIEGGLDSAAAETLYGFPFDIGSLNTYISQPTLFEALQSSPCPVNLLKDRMGDEGDPNSQQRRRAVKYVFSAATLSEPESCGNFATGDEVPEETPATFQFIVTPGDEFGNKGDEQPLKVISPL
jgi:hypothetical protein